MPANYVIKCKKGYWVYDTGFAAKPNQATRITNKTRAQSLANALNTRPDYSGGMCEIYPLTPINVTDETTNVSVTIVPHSPDAADA